MQSQGNVCQGNGKKRFEDYSPDNHSPDFSPAFSILHPPSSLFALIMAGWAGQLVHPTGNDPVAS
jgi:hypothetical protein